MKPENMDEWSASDWSMVWGQKQVMPRQDLIESDDERFARAKDITPTQEKENG